MGNLGIVASSVKIYVAPAPGIKRVAIAEYARMARWLGLAFVRRADLGPMLGRLWRMWASLIAPVDFAQMLAACGQLKVLDPVVLAIVVDVVEDQSGRDRPVGLLPKPAMLQTESSVCLYESVSLWVLPDRSVRQSAHEGSFTKSGYLHDSATCGVCLIG